MWVLAVANGWPALLREEEMDPGWPILARAERVEELIPRFDEEGRQAREASFEPPYLRIRR
jgi:hypothetical protein